jgi:hypothetical protein
MTKTKAIIFTAFVLAMGAGVAVGMLGSRTLPRPRPDGPQTWLTQELQLTSDQQAQMNQIWSGLLQTKGREFGEQLHSLQVQHDEAVHAMLSTPQQDQYRKLNEEFAQRARDLWKRFEQEFLAASETTRKILNDAQRVKYDVLVNKFRSEHASGDWFVGGPMGRMPATLPSGPKP